MVNASRLIHEATLYNPVDSLTVKGQQIVTYPTAWGNMWVAVDPLSGRELFWAKQMRADLTHKITMRWHPDISHRWRLHLYGQVYEFGPPLPYQTRQEYIEITAVQLPMATTTTTTTPAP